MSPELDDQITANHALLIGYRQQKNLYQEIKVEVVDGKLKIEGAFESSKYSDGCFNLGKKLQLAGDLHHALEAYELSYEVEDDTIVKFRELNLNKLVFNSYPLEDFIATRHIYNRGHLLACIAEVEYRLGDNDQAMEDSESAVFDLSATIETLSNLLKLPSGIAQTYAPDAYQQWENNIRLSTKLRAETLILNGIISRDEKDSKKAIGCFENAMLDYKHLSNFVGVASAELQIGKTYYDFKEFKKSKSYLQNAINTISKIEEPPKENANYYQILAMAYWQISNIESIDGNEEEATKKRWESVSIYNTLFSLGIGSSDDFYNRSRIFSLLNEPEKAARDLYCSVKLSPYNLENRIAFANELAKIGHLYHSLDQYQIILRAFPRRRDLWEQAVLLVKKIQTEKTENSEYLIELQRVADLFINMPDDYSLKHLPEIPREDDLFYLLRDEIEAEISHQTSIATGKSPAPETYVHKLADLIGFIGPEVIGGGLPASLLVGSILKKAMAPVIKRVNRWNQLKSQNIVRALSGQRLDGENGFINYISENIAHQYGKIIENLELNSIGLMGFVATIVERMFVEMGNNPELVDKIKRREIDAVSAFSECIKAGSANYPVMDKRMIIYDSKDIINGVYDNI